MPSSQPILKIVHLRIPGWLFRKLKAMALSRALNLSSLCRELLAEGLKTQAGIPPQIAERNNETELEFIEGLLNGTFSSLTEIAIQALAFRDYIGSGNLTGKRMLSKTMEKYKLKRRH